MKKTLLTIMLMQALVFAHAENTINTNATDTIENTETAETTASAYENGYNFAIETHYRLAYVEKQQEQNRQLIEQQRNALAGEKYQIYKQMAELKASDRLVAWGSLLMLLFSLIIIIGGVIIPFITYRRSQRLHEEIQEEKEIWEEERHELKKILQTLNARVNEFDFYESDEILAEFSKEMLKINSHLTLDEEKQQEQLTDEEKEILTIDSEKLAEQAIKSQSPRQFLQSAQLSYSAGNYQYALQQVNQALALLKEKQSD